MGYAKLIKNYSPEIIQLTQTNYNQLDTSVKNNGNIYITTDTHQLYQNSQGFIPGEATAAANGLMSSADKTKLNGIATGAEVNQNAFSNITIGSSTIAADSKTDTLTLTAGNSIALTPSISTDTVTIAVAGSTAVGNNSNVPTGAAIQSYVTGLGYTKNTGTVTKITAGAGLSGGTITTTGTISLASGVITASSAGPTAAVTGNEGTTIAIPRITVDTYGRVTGLTSYNLTNKNTTYAVATTSTNGLMSTADRTILNRVGSSQTSNVVSKVNELANGNITTWYHGPIVYKRGNLAVLIMDFTCTAAIWANKQELKIEDPTCYPLQECNLNISPNRLNAASSSNEYALPFVQIATDGKIYIGGYDPEHKGLRVTFTYLTRD